MKSKSNLLNNLIWISAIIAVNIIGGFVFFRWDLTSEKRHSLTEETKELIRDLEDVVFITVYLEGDLPAEFNQLKTRVKEKLDEMRAYSDLVQYEFINPSESELEFERREVYQQLVDEGLTPTTIPLREKDGVSEKIIFPGAIIRFGDRSIPLQLLKSQELVPSSAMINRSIANLEYFLSSSIHRASSTYRPIVGFSRGHGESIPLANEDVTKELEDLYDIMFVPISEKLTSLSSVNLLVVSNPSIAFTEKEKFVLDQFVMRGGKIIWLLNGMNADLDSLKGNTQFLATSRSLNIEDLLFKYGVRLNRDLVLDQNCGPLMVNVGTYGNKPKLEPFPWFYHPVVVPEGNHPIQTNVDPVLMQFPSSIDTIGNKGVLKTILLSSSPFNKKLKSPVRVNINAVGLPPDFTDRASKQAPMAVLLEGRFQSLFTHRLPANILNSPEINFRDSSILNKMLIISDGSFIENKVDTVKKTYYPLGYDDQVAKRPIFGNKAFFLNAVNYLLGDESLIAVREREVKVRKLDADKLVNQKDKYQSINIILPLLFLLLLGLGNFIYRRKKFAH